VLTEPHYLRFPFVLQLVVGVDTATARTSAFNEAFDSGMEGCLEVADDSVAISDVVRSSTTRGIDITYVITAGCTNTEIVTNRLEDETTVDCCTAALRANGFPAATCGQVVSTRNRSPSQSPTPLPTADYVSLYVIQTVEDLPRRIHTGNRRCDCCV
jgi:hypothetical protein